MNWNVRRIVFGLVLGMLSAVGAFGSETDEAAIREVQARQWLITSFQNTNGVPESPFPKGPPASHPKGGGGS